jgi:TonB family protein
MVNIAYPIVLILFLAGGVVAQERVLVTAANESLRGTPDLNGKVIYSVKRNESLELIRERGGWCLVQGKDFVGWIRSSSILNIEGKATAGTGTGRGTGKGSAGGVGNGAGSDLSDGDGVPKLDRALPTSPTSKLRILSKPKANYTDKARMEAIQGRVVLRVTFLSSGKVGNISVTKGLPFGLSAQAVEAAKLMRFEPERKNGITKTVSKSIEYSFTIY